MASVEHCLYCFEALASHFDRRKGHSLQEIQQSWAEYAKSLPENKKQIPALQRLTEPVSDTGSASSGSSVSLTADTPDTSTTSLPALLTESPLFVTWNTISAKSGERSLRGCIGTFAAQDLDSGLSEYALTSALEDTRFPPVRAAELPTFEVAVTLLTDFEDCDDAMDWTLGVHGLRISFVLKGLKYGATYLPDIAVEQEWTKEETLISLMRKAGWRGRTDSWKEVELKVVRYQGKKESLEYDEYKKWYDFASRSKKTRTG
ncbi:hypothetical protein ACHAQH_001408 [Verticillium albo-atrum]